MQLNNIEKSAMLEYRHEKIYKMRNWDETKTWGYVWQTVLGSHIDASVCSFMQI